jgi:biotin carboxyl carrier protein
MKYFARIDGKAYEFDFGNGNGRVVARCGEEEVELLADFVPVRSPCCYSLRLGDDSLQVAFEHRPDGLSVTVGDESYLVIVEDERQRAAREVAKGKGGSDQAKVVLSMMPGIVRDVRVAPGDEVTAGQPLLILEAMKMENEIRAALDGRVKTVHVAADTTVNKGDPLITLE